MKTYQLDSGDEAPCCSCGKIVFRRAASQGDYVNAPRFFVGAAGYTTEEVLFYCNECFKANVPLEIYNSLKIFWHKLKQQQEQK